MSTTPKEQRSKSRLELAVQVRFTCVIAIFALSILTLEEWIRLPTFSTELVLLKVAMLALLGTEVLVLRTKAGIASAVPIVLAGGAILVPLVVWQATMLDAPFMLPVATILLTMTSATLPWPFRYHVLVVTYSLTAITAEQLLLGTQPSNSKPLLALSLVLIATTIGIASSTSRRRTQLRRAQVRMRESEERFRQLAEHSRDIIWVWNPTPSLEYVNPAYEQFTGLAPEPLFEDPLKVLQVMHPDDRSRLRKALFAISKGRTKTLDLTVAHKDGRHFAFEAWGAPILDHRGKVVRSIGVWRDITKRAAAAEELGIQATTDPLTGIHNGRFLRALAKKELARAHRKGTSVSIVLFDIDYFKKSNDQYGHPAGDQILVQVTERCSQAVRTSDTLARYGGDEFVALLPESEEDGAASVAEILRHKIADSPVVHAGRSLHLTASFGVASSEPGAECFDLDTLLSRADQALYAAKDAGRNCVRAWSDLEV